MPWVSSLVKEKSCVFSMISGMAIMIPPLLLQIKSVNDGVRIYITVWLWHTLKYVLDKVTYSLKHNITV
jgi:hypothetical protein